MKHCRYFPILILCLLCVIQKAHAQEPDAPEVSDYTSLSTDDYIKMSLPTLDELFEKAKQSPRYELADVRAQVERKLLSKEKRAFLKFFSIRGSYQYGMLGNDGTYTDINQPVISNYSTTAQNSYTVGAAISIPIDELFDLGGRVKRQKLILKGAELEKDIELENVKKEIIELYATALSQLNILKLRAEALTLSTLQYEIAEKDFTNGTIDSSTLSVEKERQSKAMEAFEASRFELTKSLMILEVITRTPILRK